MSFGIQVRLAVVSLAVVACLVVATGLVACRPGTGADSTAGGGADDKQEMVMQLSGYQEGGDDSAKGDAKSASASGAAGGQPGQAPPVTHPFPRRSKAPEFPRDAEWLNTNGPIRLADLRGKFVLLDFWTYCCINCMHILPELKKLERAYPNQVVVIGVHSAKFTTEEDKDNIAAAILRYDIEHPVVVDSNHRIWRDYDARSWPSLRVIDPEGNLVAGHSGEIRFETLDQFFKSAIPYYRQKKLLDESPVRFELLAHRQPETPLLFPGKVLADADRNRLFITDSNHHRIVVTDLEGKLQKIIGSGEQGTADGDFRTAQFHHPQGCAVHGDFLYVADTENHMIRRVDLKRGQVRTLAGTGVQADFPWPRPKSLPPGRVPERWVGNPLTTELNSPWALWVHERFLYIAMAGPHQIWRMTLRGDEIEPYAGNSREDIVDGRLLPSQPYEVAPFGETPYSSFAQPSGLSSDGTWLYVADSEGSSIRAVPLDGKGLVRTVVGTAHLPTARLFTFGDVDGPPETARLQHPLGVVYVDGKLYVADTYNNKIRVVDAESGRVETLAGDGKEGSSDSPARFDEPAGISYANGKLYVADTNNHLIRVVDPRTGRTTTLDLPELKPPPASRKPSVKYTAQTTIPVPEKKLRAKDGKLAVDISVKLPAGWKLNPLAVPICWVESPEGGVLRDAENTPTFHLDKAKQRWTVQIPVRETAEGRLRIGLEVQYCREKGEGICRVHSVAWEFPVKIAADDGDARLQLDYRIAAPTPEASKLPDFGSPAQEPKQ